ncbi:hypothetical protein [Paraglaciecola sp.]|uniref:hypothetical protein n=1 Tax=Paraglaciecola sp. TaxID=1920173 RepID=UPI003264F204
MIDFSKLENWHTDEAAILSPILEVFDQITTDTDPESSIYKSAVTSLAAYVPALDKNDPTLVKSLKRKDADNEIYQKGDPNGWAKQMISAMESLRLTLKEENGVYFLEDTQTIEIAFNDKEKLKITKWRVDHSLHKGESAFTDTLTWSYASEVDGKMDFTTSYSWRGYR